MPLGGVLTWEVIPGNHLQATRTSSVLTCGWWWVIYSMFSIWELEGIQQLAFRRRSFKSLWFLTGRPSNFGCPKPRLPWRILWDKTSINCEWKNSLKTNWNGNRENILNWDHLAVIAMWSWCGWSTYCYNSLWTNFGTLLFWFGVRTIACGPFTLRNGFGPWRVTNCWFFCHDLHQHLPETEAISN